MKNTNQRHSQAEPVRAQHRTVDVSIVEILRRLFLSIAMISVIASLTPQASAGENPERANESNPPQLLYWKWDESILKNDAVETGLADIFKRSDFTSIYVSFHWLTRPFSDPELQGAISRCASWLKARGKTMILDVDIRNEGNEFLTQYPNEQAWFAEMIELDLDSSGCATKDLDPTTTLRWGQKKTEPPAALLSSWLLNPSNSELARSYVSGSLERADKLVRLNLEGSGKSRIEVTGSAPLAGRRVVVFVGHKHVCPDFFSPHFEEYFDTMLGRLKGVPLGGVGTDEWGYSLTTWWDKEMFARLIPYSPFMSTRYKNCFGKDLQEDLIHLFYREEGAPGRSIRTVNEYLGLFRKRMAENEAWLYGRTKTLFGSDAFYGVHPTWMGSEYDLMIEGLYNGFDWWDAPRDYAQVDEDIIIPVRLSLGHKVRSSNWYSMWYVWGADKSSTSFYRETWRNARFGGRTHYLGYRCPKEGLLELRNPGELEAIWSMEKEIRRLNEFHLAAPNSKIGIVFSIDAACNWNLSGTTNYPIGQRNILLRRSFEFANKILNSGWLCDLVPSSAIASGEMHIQDGKYRYGTQVYDAIFVVEPESLDEKVFKSLESYFDSGGRGAILGSANFDSLGRPVHDRLVSLGRRTASCASSSEYVTFAIRALEDWRILRNNFENGCELQGGAYIFTAEGASPTGNQLSVTQSINGHLVEFSGTDFLALKFDSLGNLQKTLSGSQKCFKVDGAVRK